MMRIKPWRITNYAPIGKAANSNGQKENKVIDSENENESKPQPTL